MKTLKSRFHEVDRLVLWLIEIIMELYVFSNLRLDSRGVSREDARWRRSLYISFYKSTFYVSLVERIPTDSSLLLVPSVCQSF